MSLFGELNRRNVFRVAIAYLIAAWLVLQVSQLVLETVEAPSWVLKVFLLIFALGFPFALLFSWAYELTPEGVKRESDIDRSNSVTQHTGHKLNQVTIVMVVALLIFIAADRMFLSKPAQPAAQESSVVEAEAVTDRSIAVLAFDDLSPDGDQGYFADGLSEELLNVLARTPGLQVAGRTSSFAFKGQNRDLREIGEILNVANILEGSVRKSGNKIRVTAQLINATTGFHLYSETYDRDLTDVFAVQDEIAASISGALRAELIGTEPLLVAETSIAAYDLYLVARQKIYTRDINEMKEASRLLDQALDLDGEYAPALAQKALALVLLSDGVGSYGEVPAAEAHAAARILVDRAIVIDAGLAEAFAVSGLIMSAENDTTNAEEISTLEYALRLNPNLDNTRNWLSIAYGDASRNDESRALLEAVVERDPMFGPAFNNLIQDYIGTRDFDLGNALVGRVERIVGETDDVNQSWGMIALAQGNSARAIRHLRRSYEINPSNTVNQLWYSGALLSIGEFETTVEVGRPVSVASALDQLGRFDEAQSILDTVPVGNSGNDTNNAVMSTVAFHFMVSGRYDAAVRYVEEHFTDLDAVLQRFERTDGSNSGYLAPLAYSYLQAGREQEFKKLTDALAESAARRIVARDKSFGSIYNSINLAALTGTDEDVLIQVQKLVDNDGLGVSLFDTPIFDRMQENTEFRKLNAIFVKRANDERAKLGLGPYLPGTLSN
jgi:TolB-like protein/tetratricopeptide (TPR) repeat protein